MRKKTLPKPKISFFVKSFLSFLFITILCVILVTSFLSLNYLNSASNLVYKFNSQLIAQTNYSVDYINDLAVRLARSLQSDKDIQNFLNLQNRNELAIARTNIALDTALMPLNSVQSVYLYNSTLDLCYSTLTGEQSSLNTFYDKKISEILSGKQYKDMNGKFYTHEVVVFGKKEFICSYILCENNYKEDKPLSALIININTTTILEAIQSINRYVEDEKSQFLVLDENGTEICSTLDTSLENYSVIMEAIKNILDTTSPSNPVQTIHIPDTEQFLVYSNNNPNHWTICSIVSQQQLFHDLITASFIGIVISIGVALACTCICLLIAKHLNNPVRALTHIVKGEPLDKLSTSLPKEFDYLSSAFSDMKQANEKLELLKEKTLFSFKNDFLNRLINENETHSLSNIVSQIDTLGLSYLIHSRLCICLLKIDEYRIFSSQNSHSERWAMRYAIVNIISELAENNYRCEIFTTNTDQFVLILDCSKENEFSVFRKNFEAFLVNVQNTVQRTIHISLSITYSTWFSGIEHLRKQYVSLQEAIHLKLWYGHGCIINPFMIDEHEMGDFHIPYADETAMLDQLVANKPEDAIRLYHTIAEQLFCYTYEEVYYYLSHWTFRIFTVAQLKAPGKKQKIAELFRQFMADLQQCEIREEVDKIACNLIYSVCEVIDQSKFVPTHQSNEMIAQKVCSIIECNYNKKDLCVSSIADEMGLTPNYVGHIFKDVQKVSISRYILDIRMKKVEYYLHHSNLSIPKIIDNIGMEHSSYFYT